ncbi:MAG: hypothetical protein IH788_05965 [Nitrospinae bacterium]|nr:hypothetical protein [Nitrospinota bacterium]
MVPPGGRLEADSTGTVHVLPPGAKLVEGADGRWLVKPLGALLVEGPDGRSLVTLPGLPQGAEVVVGANGRLVVRRTASVVGPPTASHQPLPACGPPVEVIRGETKNRAQRGCLSQSTVRSNAISTGLPRL